MFWSRSFAMRMTNRVLPCEMVASSGEGVACAALALQRAAQHMIPRSESELSVRSNSNHGVDSAFNHSVVQRWREATMGNKRKIGETAAEPGKPAGERGHS